MKWQVSSPLLSNPVSCSNFCCFCFWHLASALFWSHSPRHLDKSSLSVPVSLSALVSPPPLLSLSECVFWSPRHCTLPTLCKNGPSVCAYVFPAWETGFLWFAVLYSHWVMSDGEGKLGKLRMKCASKQTPSVRILKERLLYMHLSENPATPVSGKIAAFYIITQNYSNNHSTHLRVSKWQ